MRLELITKREDLAALATRWNELALCDSRDGFFRTWPWYNAWMEHIRPDAEPFVVVARENSDRVVGIAPLCRLKYRDLGFDLTAVALAGREVVSGDFLGTICEPEVSDTARAAILKFLWETRSRWGLLVMGELVRESEELRCLEDLGLRNGLPLRRQEPRICPYIALPATFDEYLNTLGSSTRYHIRRRIRDVEKRGATVEDCSTPEELFKGLNTLVRLHLARWQKEGQPGTFGRPGFTDFLQTIFRTMPQGASCRIYQLVHEGSAIAALMTFTFGESVLYYQAGWDPDSSLSSLSPAVVLMAQSIRDAIDGGFRYYEFLRGDEAYKSRWTKTWRNTVTLLAGRSLGARGYLQAARLKDSVKPLFNVRMAPAAEREEPQTIEIEK